MKASLIFWFIVFTVLSASAQTPITLGNTNMPGSGDTLRYTGIQLSSIGNYTQTGVNFTWNFSTVVSTAEGVRSFKSALQTPYALFFLSQNEYGEKISDTIGAGPIILTKYYDFYRKQTSPNAFIADGAGITFSSIPLPSYYSDKDELYNFPMTYPKYDSTSFKFSTIASTIVPLRYSKTGFRATRVDGWGTITTPYGTQSCLRLITTQYSMDSIKISVGVFPIVLGFPNVQRSYQWLTTTSKIPFLEVSGTVANNMFTPTEARYRGYAVPVNTTGFHELGGENAVMLYPNPVVDKLILSEAAAAPVVIYNSLGQQQKALPVEGEVIDVSGLEAGIYFISSAHAEKQQWYKFIKQ